MYILLAYFKMFVLCYFFNIDLYMFDKINLLLLLTKNAKLREAILEHADAELIRALCECAHNILRGNVKMTPREKTRLRK